MTTTTYVMHTSTGKAAGAAAQGSGKHSNFPYQQSSHVSFGTSTTAPSPGASSPTPNKAAAAPQKVKRSR